MLWCLSHDALDVDDSGVGGWNELDVHRQEHEQSTTGNQVVEVGAGQLDDSAHEKHAMVKQD